MDIERFVVSHEVKVAKTSDFVFEHGNEIQPTKYRDFTGTTLEFWQFIGGNTADLSGNSPPFLDL